MLLDRRRLFELELRDVSYLRFRGELFPLAHINRLLALFSLGFPIRLSIKQYKKHMVILHVLENRKYMKI